jgi:hypothetical protein
MVNLLDASTSELGVGWSSFPEREPPREGFSADPMTRIVLKRGEARR